MEEIKLSDNTKTLMSTVFINGNKISTLIPNRIFVGGFPANTTESELRDFFAKHGEIKDVKIIPDKTGQSKGSYGFVTFESQEIAEKIIAEQAESLLFRDRKLNIGRAVKKQPLTPKSEMQNSLVLNPLSLAYGSLYPYQDYSYLFNQDLSALYQNYASMFPQMSILPSLFSPMISSNDSLGFSLNQYQQMQPLLPFSLSQQFSGLSPCTTPLSTIDTSTPGSSEPFSIAALLSTSSLVSSSGLTETLPTSDSVTISSPYQSYGVDDPIKSDLKTSPKLPFTAITNKYKIPPSNYDIFCRDNNSDESELPRKKIKYEESVTRSGDPVHYIHPN